MSQIQQQRLDLSASRRDWVTLMGAGRQQRDGDLVGSAS
ncbi:hypothetical protein RZN68_06930 [Enterobacter hormaechei]|nr:hypothetical protein [Enterobacter hormaechei]